MGFYESIKLLPLVTRYGKKGEQKKRPHAESSAQGLKKTYLIIYLVANPNPRSLRALIALALTIGDLITFGQ